MSRAPLRVGAPVAGGASSPPPVAAASAAHGGAAARGTPAAPADAAAPDAGREPLRPVLKQLCFFAEFEDPDLAEISVKHMQKLARHYGLAAVDEGFWEANRLPKVLAATLMAHIASGVVGYKSVLGNYEGDKFSTRGVYEGGMFYRSRLPSASSTGSGLGGTTPFTGRVAPQESSMRATGALISLPALNTAKAISPRPGGGAFFASIVPSSMSPPLAGGGRSTRGGGGGDDDDDDLPRRVSPSPDPLAVGGANTFDTLVGLATSGSESSHQCCAQALARLTQRTGTIRGLVRSGAVRALVTIYRSSGDSTTRSDCLSALCDIVTVVHDGAVLLDGASAMMVDAVAGPARSSNALQERVAAVLAIVAGDVWCHAAILDTDVVTRLTAAYASLALVVQRALAATARALAVNTAIFVRAVSNGLVPLVLVLLSTSDEVVRTDAVVALQRCMALPDVIQRVVDADVVVDVIAVCEADNSANIAGALSVLDTISSAPEGREAIIDCGGVTALLTLIASEDQAASVRDVAARIVRVMTEDPACRAPMIEDGALMALIRLAGDGVDAAQRDCAAAMCCLLLGEGGAKDAGLTTGVVSKLSALARSEDDDMRRKAAMTLCDLSYEAAAVDRVQTARITLLWRVYVRARVQVRPAHSSAAGEIWRLRHRCTTRAVQKRPARGNLCHYCA